MSGKVIRILVACLILVATSRPLSAQIDVSKLGDLVGWTVAVDTHIQGEFEGPDYDKVVRLDNGWIISFHDYDYFYEYHPEIVIFSTQFKGVTLYRAVIDGGDDIYDVTRVR
jgi:hypothetical protein